MRTSEPDFEDGTLNAYQISGAEVKKGDRFGYKVIAVVDPVYGWAVYRGPTGWSDERVAAEGDKVSNDVAVSLFPTLAACLGNSLDW